MSLRTEIKGMEQRREDLLDDMHRDVKQLTHQVQQAMSPAALVQKYPFGAMAAAIVAGLFLTRGARRRRSAAEPAGPAAEPARSAAESSTPKSSAKSAFGKIVDTAIRSGAADIIATVPWHEMPGLWRKFRGKSEKSGRPPAAQPDSAEAPKTMQTGETGETGHTGQTADSGETGPHRR